MVFTVSVSWAGNWLIWEGCTLRKSAYHDGDSFYIRTRSGASYIIRLYFVDCPEVDDEYDDRVVQQARHFGVDARLISRFGSLSTQFTERELSHPFTVYTKKADALGNSSQPRYFGFVRCSDGVFLGEKLVREGWARAYGAAEHRPDGKSDGQVRSLMAQHQQEARRLRKGIWGKNLKLQHAAPVVPPSSFEVVEQDPEPPVEELPADWVVDRKTAYYSIQPPYRVVGNIPKGTLIRIRGRRPSNMIYVIFEQGGLDVRGLVRRWDLNL